MPPAVPAIGAYAGFWRRFLAVFIDGILVGIVAGVLGAFTGASFMAGDGGFHYNSAIRGCRRSSPSSTKVY